MKKILPLFLALLIPTLCLFPACAASGGSETVISLSDSGVTVDGSAASANATAAVYVGADIVYYEAGHDASYGEGTAADEHSAAVAAAHTVVTITQPGTYRVSGALTAGQLAVDLGDDAPSDPTAVVTLILDGANITCTVAPAVIFYNVYECGSTDAEAASAAVDTKAAGANVVIADGSVNNINGAYVARIYKEGTTKKLHKYDGAFYSKQSMNVSGGPLGTGVLNIVAENEGLDSELHLTIHGGVFNITAQNDGINTNEDGISVTTINGGAVTINAGFGVEGDGIDSNGYLVINGGTIIATANPRTGDGGIDADMGIFINGGTVLAFGSRNDAVSASSKQAFMDLSYTTTQTAGTQFRLTDAAGNEIISHAPARDYPSVTVSTPTLSFGTTYHVYADGVQQQYGGAGLSGRPGGGMRGGTTPPDGTERPARQDGTDRPTPPEGMTQPPEGMERPQDGTPPDGFDPGQMPGGFGNQGSPAGEGAVDFVPTADAHSFSGVSAATGGGLPFTDVGADHAYYAAIDFVHGAGLMSGTGDNAFSPDTAVSRAMAITVLGRLAAAEPVAGAAFTDVDAGSWYAPYVGWAEQNAIVQGYGNGLFGPNDAVTRQEIFVIMYQYAQSAGISLSASSPTYSDATAIASWAYDAVGACAASGLSDGIAAAGTVLNPQAALTRAELADVLMRLAEWRL